MVAVGFGVVAGPGGEDMKDLAKKMISSIKEKHQKNIKAKTTFSLTFEFPVADCLHLRALVG